MALPLVSLVTLDPPCNARMFWIFCLVPGNGALQICAFFMFLWSLNWACRPLWTEIFLDFIWPFRDVVILYVPYDPTAPDITAIKLSKPKALGGRSCWKEAPMPQSSVTFVVLSLRQQVHANLLTTRHHKFVGHEPIDAEHTTSLSLQTSSICSKEYLAPGWFFKTCLIK